jgi:hypothetical protein
LDLPPKRLSPQSFGFLRASRGVKRLARYLVDLSIDADESRWIFPVPLARVPFAGLAPLRLLVAQITHRHSALVTRLISTSHECQEREKISRFVRSG